MKKLKNGYNFINIDHMEKFQINKPPPQSLGIQVFPSVNRNRISASAIIKKLKNGYHFINIDRTEKIQITDPPSQKFESLVF